MTIINLIFDILNQELFYLQSKVNPTKLLARFHNFKTFSNTYKEKKEKENTSAEKRVK